MRPPFISVASVPNEQYAPNAPSSSDHDNEDEYLVHSDSFSVYLCVLDGHDGQNAVEFVKKYLQDNYIAISHYQSCEVAITECIKNADAEYFRGIHHHIDELTEKQKKIPKVSNAPGLVNTLQYSHYVQLCSWLFRW